MRAVLYARNHVQVYGMTTYSIREFRTRVSAILRNLDDGEEVIITRRGEPCGRLMPVQRSSEAKPSLGTLRGALANLPDASYEDFQNLPARSPLPVIETETATRAVSTLPAKRQG